MWNTDITCMRWEGLVKAWSLTERHNMYRYRTWTHHWKRCESRQTSSDQTYRRLSKTQMPFKNG